MKFAPIFAALALAGACTTQPEPIGQQRIEAIQPLPFISTHSSVQLRPVDAGSSYMKRLVEHVPVRAVERDWWTSAEGHNAGDTYVVATSRAELEDYLASADEEPPADREIALGRTDDGWRSYLVSSTPAIDETHITHASFERNADTDRMLVTFGLDALGTARLHELTALSVAKKLAILVDGAVVAAPVVMGAISGGHVQISL